MNTGKLNRRISYTTFGTYTDTPLGGKVLSVAGASVETWCSARQLSMREQISYGLPVDFKIFEFGFIYERGANISNGIDELKIGYDKLDQNYQTFFLNLI